MNHERILFGSFYFFNAALAGELEPAATAWTPTIAWILQGDQYVSTQNIQVKDRAFFDIRRPAFEREAARHHRRGR